jgi:hypothetical protein
MDRCTGQPYSTATSATNGYMMLSNGPVLAQFGNCPIKYLDRGYMTWSGAPAECRTLAILTRKEQQLLGSVRL